MATTTGSSTKRKSDGSPTATTADIEQQLSQLRTDIASLAKTVTAYGTSKVDDTRAKADEARAGLVDTTNEAIEALNEQIISLRRQLRTQVRDSPFQAIGIAAGVGFLIALLMRRR